MQTPAFPRGTALLPLGIVLFATTALLCTPSAASAQAGIEVNGVPRGQAVEDLHLAWQLAAQGRRARSPLSLIVAADILVSNPTRPLETENLPASDPQGTPAHIAELLEEARTIARGDRSVLSMIEQVQRRADRLPRGPLRGARGAPRERRAALAGGQRQSYVVTFLGREPALVRVAGNTQSNLNLYIYDEYDNLIASDTNPTDLGTALWTPPRTGKFRIEVRNLGSNRNTYWLVTN